MDLLAVHKSSKRPDWNTPQPIIDLVRKFAGPIGISLDPCSNPQSIVHADTEWSLEDGYDGLKEDWGPFSIVYVNPPYGRGIIDWVRKANHHRNSDQTETIMLVPARPDTRWFREIWKTASSVCFISGRVKFLGAKANAPFPSALIYWGFKNFTFDQIFYELGKVLSF